MKAIIKYSSILFLIIVFSSCVTRYKIYELEGVKHDKQTFVSDSALSFDIGITGGEYFFDFSLSVEPVAKDSIGFKLDTIIVSINTFRGKKTAPNELKLEQCMIIKYVQKSNGLKTDTVIEFKSIRDFPPSCKTLSGEGRLITYRFLYLDKTTRSIYQNPNRLAVDVGIKYMKKQEAYQKNFSVVCKEKGYLQIWLFKSRFIRIPVRY